VVVVGLTVVLEPATAPTPWSMNKDDAPESLHDRVDDEPEAMLVGVAVNDEITGALVGGVPPPGSLVDEPPHAAMTTPARMTATRGSLLVVPDAFNGQSFPMSWRDGLAVKDRPAFPRHPRQSAG
jgi:hypothetical protein